MAAKSVLKSSTSAVLGAVLGLGLAGGLMLPAAASAQERDRGERGAGRMERSMSAPAPSRSAPPAMPRQMERPAQSPARAPQAQGSFQGRGQPSMPQQVYNGRPAWTQGTAQGMGQPDRGPRPNAQIPAQIPSQSGSGSRPSWQQGDRGDRGNGMPANGRPGYGRPGSTGTPPSVVTNTNPAWTGRNPTYSDPARNPSNRPQPGRDGRTVDYANDHTQTWSKNSKGEWYRDTGWQWRQNRQGQWYRDHDDNWGRNNNGKWYRNGWGANTPRDPRRGGNSGWQGNNGWGYNNGGYNNGWGYNNGGYNNGWNNGYANGYSNGWRAWDRDDWRRDNRYNWFGWRSSHRDVFRGGYYSAPFSDYSYSRLSIGLILGNAFFDQRYWIADPYAYRLPPAYEPYQWVRYYDDVVLVDTYTGEVVDVVYDFFD